MTAQPTKIQRAKRDKNLTARQRANKKYFDRSYRSKKNLHNMWHYMFCGKIPIEKLFKTYGITP